jgi:hypothetical protein
MYVDDVIELLHRSIMQHDTSFVDLKISVYYWSDSSSLYYRWQGSPEVIRIFISSSSTLMSIQFGFGV